MDRITKEQRSEIMGRVRSKDTGPEMVVRRATHAMGFRYRLHSRMLPGQPDLVFASRRKVIFVHGCFWHGHGRCRNVRPPKSNKRYWGPKLEGNKKRDRKNRRALSRMGWRILVVWECQTSDAQVLSRRIRAFLDGHESQ